MEELQASPLLQHLTDNYPVHLYSQLKQDGFWTDADLTHGFFTTFGVNIWIESLFYEFKYEVCTVLEWSPVVDECRGSIMYRSDQGWTHATRPFSKFFNRTESMCPYSDASKFDEEIEEFQISEKADGSCLQMWYCDPKIIEVNHIWIHSMNQKVQESGVPPELISTLEEQSSRDKNSKPTHSKLEKRDHFFQRKMLKEVVRKKGAHSSKYLRMPVHHSGWRVSTLARITPEQKLEKLFFKFFPQSVDLGLVLSPRCTYLFELCCKENRVVTLYREDFLFLIGVRNLDTGYCFGKEELDEVGGKLVDLNCNIVRPYTVSLKELGIHSLKECEEWINEEGKKIKKYGDHPEGFVLLKEGAPIAKMKNPAYLLIHQLTLGSLLYLRNVAIDHFFSGTIDDIISILPPPICQLVEELKDKTRGVMEEVNCEFEKIKMNVLCRIEGIREEELKNKWQKVFAEEVKNYKNMAKNDFSGFFFVNKETLMFDDTVNPGQLFLNTWLKSHYNLYNDIWKNTQIPEILEEERIQEKVEFK